MKTTRYIIAIIAFALLGVLGYAEEAKPQAKEAISDEFLRFALDKAKQYTGTAEQVVGNAVDIIQKEAPETVEQFLKWRFVKHLLCFAIPATIFVIAGSSLLAFWYLHETKPQDFTPGIVMSFCIAVISGGATCATFEQLLCAIQIHVAPRIYLIEELGKLLK